jgi:hypothetical protein
MLTLIIETRDRVRLPGGELVVRRTPVLEACRRLIAAGTDPKSRFEAWWEGARHAALLGSVGGAAKLDVFEPDAGAPRFRPWRPHPHSNMPRARFPRGAGSASERVPATPLAAPPLRASAEAIP